MYIGPFPEHLVVNVRTNCVDVFCKPLVALSGVLPYRSKCFVPVLCGV